MSPRSSSAKFPDTSRLNGASSSIVWSAMSVVTVGPSLVLSTVTVNVLDADASPSDAVTVIDKSPTSPFSGVPDSSPVSESIDIQSGRSSPFSRVAE